MTSSSGIDPSALDQMFEDTGGDAEFIVEIIDDYLVNARGLLASLATALAAGDAEAARGDAHTLKGTSASLGARALSALAAEVETLCKAGAAEQGAAYLSRLEEALALVEPALQREQARFRAEA